MRKASMRQLALLRGPSSPSSPRAFGQLSTLRWQDRGNAVNALTTWPCSLRRSSHGTEHVPLLPGRKTAILGAQQLRPLSSSTSTDGEGGDQEETGTYSEADHEHAVISAFDLLYVKLLVLNLGSPILHLVHPLTQF